MTRCASDRDDAIVNLATKDSRRGQPLLDTPQLGHGLALTPEAMQALREGLRRDRP
jgi:hypothetical protein